MLKTIEHEKRKKERLRGLIRGLRRFWVAPSCFGREMHPEKH